MPNWTDAQLDAIKARRGTVLVSAAAGSGKTAVLVERVIERLTDLEHPTDADRLLVVTFTKAAAAEMRDRIEKRLLALMKEQPENTRLRRQQLLLQQAHICTVDSFCSDIVREFFYLLGISPDFSIITDKQQEELMTESLDEILTEWYKPGGCARRRQKRRPPFRRNPQNVRIHAQPSVSGQMDAGHSKSHDGCHAVPGQNTVGRGRPAAYHGGL